MSGVWVQVSEFRHKWYPSEEAYERAMGRGRESLSANVIDDTMPATWHPVTGEVFESKSRFRAVTRAAGCIEVGNELLSKQPERKPDSIPKEELREAIHRSLDVHGHRRD